MVPICKGGSKDPPQSCDEVHFPKIYCLPLDKKFWACILNGYLLADLDNSLFFYVVYLVGSVVLLAIVLKYSGDLAYYCLSCVVPQF